jgi:hypothetical protein
MNVARGALSKRDLSDEPSQKSPYRNGNGMLVG